MEELKTPKPKSWKKLLAIIVIIILVITGISAFFYVTLSISDPPWIFSQPDILVNRTITNNITKEVIIEMDNWEENYHDKYHVDKLYISIITWINNTETFLFNISTDFKSDLNVYEPGNGGAATINDRLLEVFNSKGIQLSDNSIVSEFTYDRSWMIRDENQDYFISASENVLEVHLPPSEYGDYSYHNKLSTVMGEHDYPVTFFDVDGDSYLSVGDYFLMNPAIISEENFDGLYFNLQLKFDSHYESIMRWDISEEDQYQYYTEYRDE